MTPNITTATRSPGNPAVNTATATPEKKKGRAGLADVKSSLATLGSNELGRAALTDESGLAAL
eukprot:4412469-Pleurochrysis_carterae.AAC.1